MSLNTTILIVVTGIIVLATVLDYLRIYRLQKCNTCGSRMSKIKGPSGFPLWDLCPKCGHRKTTSSDAWNCPS
jgi:tRNA(Ile2) C34 agmatinyltransferase TiaS